MSTLYAHRENETWFNVVTYFKTLDGKVKKTLLGKQKQIKKGTKTVIVNGQEFLVNWDNYIN